MKNKHVEAHILKRMETCKEALEKNNMQVFIAHTKEEARDIAEKLLSDCDTVTMGGCMSAKECGITELVSNGNYTFYNRSAEGLTDAEVEEIYRKAFSCDAFISSSNAITENGELYNVDGKSNRVSAMLFGSKKLIVVAGYNKIVKDIDGAIERVKSIAAPVNCMRLGINSYCAQKGHCISLDKDFSDMPSGCNSPTRICCSYTVMAYQRDPERVKVILVAEELGF